MAELILTDEEKAALSWLDLSDEELGKICRKALVDMPAFRCNDNANKQLIFFNAGLVLCKIAAESTSDNVGFDAHRVKLSGRDVGDWRVSVRQIAKPKGDSK